MENQNPQNNPKRPQRKQMAPRDMLLIALAILVMTRIEWTNMNSFHYLILFLLVLCFMLRWSNMRKDAQRKEAMMRRKAEMEAAQAAQAPAQLTGETADVPVESVAAEDVTVDGEALPAEPAAEEAAPTEEKPEA